MLPPRKQYSHKGDYGRALLIGGSRGMSGAVGLAGLATLRSGAGLVKLAVPDVCLDLVASFEPAYMTVPLPNDTAGRIALLAEQELPSLIEAATCLACGPGLGRSSDLDQLVAKLYTSVAKPMVIDADALNALAAQAGVLEQPGGPRILTPHPGEFRRLVQADSQDDSTNSLEEQAVDLANRCGIVVVLKGHQTLITDGQMREQNATGNPGMATGGSGDVLTGVITALVCQGLAPLDAAVFGTYVHGLAGDLAAAELGEVSLIASDLIDFLPAAFQQAAESSMNGA